MLVDYCVLCFVCGNSVACYYCLVLFYVGVWKLDCLIVVFLLSIVFWLYCFASCF